MDPRSLSCMTGVAARIAKRNGLHRNVRGLPIFENEMRKRVWWQINLLENRTAEMSGAGSSMLDYAWNAKMPLNVNDSELNPEMKTAPPELVRTTEMIVVVVRCEIAEFLRQVRAANCVDIGWSEFSNPAVSIPVKIRAIEDFQRHLHEKYWKHCDFQIPLHVMARSTAIYSIGKMKLAAYRSFDRHTDPTKKGDNLQNLLDVCLEMIEDYNTCLDTESINPFRWFLSTSVPFLAYIYILFHLRDMPTGEFSDRAWDAATRKIEVFGRPKLSGNYNVWEGPTAMHLAFASLMIKAWEPREAMLRKGGPLVVPDVITKMRERLAMDAISKSQSTSPEDGMAAMQITPSDSGSSTGFQPFLGWPGTTTPTAHPEQTNFVPGYVPQSIHGGGEFGSFMSVNSSAAAVAAQPMQFLTMEEDAMNWDWNNLLPDSNLGNDIDWNQAFTMYR